MSSALNTIKEKVESIDSFGSSFTMQIEKDKSELKTLMGSFFTFLIFVVSAVYSLQKVDVWMAKKDVDIMSSTQAGFFNDSYTFGYEDGLNFAVAFTAYDSETEPILDESYGKIVFRAYEWGYDPVDGSYYVR